MCQCFLNQFKWLYRSFTNKENGYSRNQYSKHSTTNPKIDQQKEQRIQQIGKSTILLEFSKNKPNTSPLTQFKQPANHVQPIHIGHLFIPAIHQHGVPELLLSQSQHPSFCWAEISPPGWFDCQNLLAFLALLTQQKMFVFPKQHVSWGVKVNS